MSGGDRSNVARKVVTALFCDVAGSTELGERLDPEALHGVLDHCFHEVAQTVRRHGGTIQKFAGDAVMAVFGIPKVHEDDPLRAVRAAVEIQGRLPAIARDVGIELQMRIGVNTGLAVTDEGRNLALGDTVNVAARLEAAAQPGEILIGALTLAQVRDAVTAEPVEPLALKGKSERVPAYRLLNLDPLAPGLARRMDLPLVNRLGELAALREAWKRTIRTSTCQLVVLTGAAGMGKSRLAEQLCRTVDSETRVLRGRCLHYGEGITFWPLIEALSGVSEEAELLGHLTEGGAATAQELFLEIRRLLFRLAAIHPLILYIDDLQWAEPTLLDLLENVLGAGENTPLLLLCTARPELRETYPLWGQGPENQTTIMLDPLHPAESEQLVEQLEPNLDQETRRRVVESSDGNPLFVEEMVALTREQGSVLLSPTIQSLLAARIDGLPAEEQEILVRASVEGEVFHRSVVCALAGETSTGPVDRQLVELVRKDLIRPDPTEVAGERAFRFRHLLIRDAAYERLPRGRRADLHERLADWLEQHAARVPEHEELAAWHLEQAIRDRERIRGKVEEEAVLRTARHLRRAAQKAANRGDLVASRGLLERALKLTPAHAQLHVDLTAALGECLVELGDLVAADRLLREAEREEGHQPSLALARLQWMIHIQPDQAHSEFRARAAMIRRELAARGDERGLAALHMLGFWLEWMSSQAGSAAHQVRRAADHALSSGDMALRARARGWYLATLIFGPVSVTELASELELIEREQPGPYLQAFLNLGHGEVARREGQLRTATELTQRAVECFDSLMLSTLAAVSQQQLGWIRLRAGDAAAAREVALLSDASLSEVGERSIRSTTQALLAQAAVQLARYDEALEAAVQAEALSSLSDVVNFAVTHGVRRQLALAAGASEEAIGWARSALEYALRSDFPIWQAEARLGLAEVLARSGDAEEAKVQVEAAAELYRLTGDRPGLATAAAVLASLGR